MSTTGYDTATVVGDIEQVSQQIAKQVGVDVNKLTNLSIATAIQESGLNPNAPGDLENGRYTSFGLFQLHEGGELGNLTPQQAFDPVINAEVAISHIAQVLKANPNASPGDIAAMAQAPAAAYTKSGQYIPNNSYAQKVNSLYNQVSTETGLINGVSGISGSLGQLIPGLGPLTGNISGAINAGSSGLSPWQYITQQIQGAGNLTKTWPALLVGIIVIGIGIALVLADNKETIATVATTAAKGAA